MLNQVVRGKMRRVDGCSMATDNLRGGCQQDRGFVGGGSHCAALWVMRRGRDRARAREPRLTRWCVGATRDLAWIKSP